MLLPMYQNQTSSAALPSSAKLPFGNGSARSKSGKIRLGDVWDEREELFGIGDSDEDEDVPATSSGRTRVSPSSQRDEKASSATGQSAGPKIIVTSSY